VEQGQGLAGVTESTQKTLPTVDMTLETRILATEALVALRHRRSRLLHLRHHLDPILN
jgi:hypothetical protein